MFYFAENPMSSSLASSFQVKVQYALCVKCVVKILTKLGKDMMRQLLLSSSEKDWLMTKEYLCLLLKPVKVKQLWVCSLGFLKTDALTPATL